jgi:hypothetical protein
MQMLACAHDSIDRSLNRPTDPKHCNRQPFMAAAAAGAAAGAGAEGSSNSCNKNGSRRRLLLVASVACAAVVVVLVAAAAAAAAKTPDAAAAAAAVGPLGMRRLLRAASASVSASTPFSSLAGQQGDGSHKPLWPLDARDGSALVLATLGLVIAAGGGIGGGGPWWCLFKVAGGMGD